MNHSKSPNRRPKNSPSRKNPQSSKRPSKRVSNKSRPPTRPLQVVKVVEQIRRSPKRSPVVSQRGCHTIVKHKEFVSSVFAPPNTVASTQIESVPVNPGNPTLLDFLSQVALNYTEYRFKRLSFKWVPAVGTTTTTGQMGFISFCFQYNASAPPFQSYPELMDYEGAVTRKVCDSFVISVDCAKQNRSVEWYMVNSGGLITNPNIYNYGTIAFCTSGIAPVYPSGTLLGRIEADYEIELAKPRLYTALGYGIQFAQAYNTYAQGGLEFWNVDNMWGNPLTLSYDTRGSLPFFFSSSAKGANYNKLIFSDDLCGHRVKVEFVATRVGGTGTSITSGFSIKTNGFSFHPDFLISGSVSAADQLSTASIVIQSASAAWFTLDLIAGAAAAGAPQECSISLDTTTISNNMSTVWWRVMIYPRTSTPYSSTYVRYNTIAPAPQAYSEEMTTEGVIPLSYQLDDDDEPVSITHNQSRRAPDDSSVGSTGSRGRTKW